MKFQMKSVAKTVLNAALPTAILLSTFGVGAAPFYFSTGNPDGLIGTGSKPSGASGTEIESADDFFLNQATSITNASFYGLVPLNSNATSVRLEMYRVFPLDSTNPPSGKVPARTNSPSDVAFAEREGLDLTYATTGLGAFTVTNTVLSNINKSPNQTTGGEGADSGQQVRFDVQLLSPFNLPADHYFFIPQVQLDQGDFLWLSAAKPIAAPGTPFTPDLQSWIRNENLAPDWLRIGTDVIGAAGAGTRPTFNAAFSLTGETLAVPEPATLALLGAGLFALLGLRRLSGCGKSKAAVRG